MRSTARRRRSEGPFRAALDASAFDWDIVLQRVTIHVARIGTSYARPGHIWLDRGLLGAGRFAWASVMDEYAHQVDFTVYSIR